VKRPLLMLGTLLLIGLVTSLGLAWSCALWAPMRDSRALTGPEADAVLQRAVPVARPSSAPQGVMNWGFGWAYVFAVDATIRLPDFTAPRPEHRLPARVTLPLAQVPTNPDDRIVHVVKAGWPLACVTGEQLRIGTLTQHRGMAQPPPVLRDLDIKPKRVLPLRPLWLGLAANSGFFAAGVWLVGPGPLLLRRALRRRRGRCPACGYILRHVEHDACPECGAARS
jgi:hypothetical protein